MPAPAAERAEVTYLATVQLPYRDVRSASLGLRAELKHRVRSIGGGDADWDSLSLQSGGTAATVPFKGGAMMAGDSVDKVLDLVNDGTTAFGSVTKKMSATTSSILDTDQVNGLQLKVQKCSVAWTASSCSGASSTLYAGPMVVTQPLTGATSLNPGGVDHLLLTASLPASANGSAYQGKQSTLSLVFDGVQRAGADR